jgi:protein-S-isoprenylcysteine O-methyltransferase Ste14
MTHDPRPSPQDNAGVRVPPPFIFALPLLAGLLLHRLWPLVTLPPGAGGPIHRAGAVLVILALLLTYWAIFSFRRMGTTVVPVQPAAALVLRGPYRFSRNPMYLAMTLLYLGICCWALALWPLLFLPVVLFIIQRAVIGREEAYLGRRFGEDYRRYLTQVRRWI